MCSSQEDAHASRTNGGVEPYCEPYARCTEHCSETLTEGISRCPRVILADKFRELIDSNESSKRDIGPRGVGVTMLCSRQINFLTITTVFCRISKWTVQELCWLACSVWHFLHSTYAIHAACLQLKKTYAPCTPTYGRNRGQHRKKNGFVCTIGGNERAWFCREEYS